METLEEVIEYIDPQSFSADPIKARSISRLFKQKGFNTQVVNALSVIANELLSRDSKTSANFDVVYSDQHTRNLRLDHIEKAVHKADQKIGAISSNLRAQDLRLEQLREELISKEERIFKILRELDHNTKKLEEKNREAQLISESSIKLINQLQKQAEDANIERAALDKKHRDLIKKVGGKAEASAKAASERIAELDEKQEALRTEHGALIEDANIERAALDKKHRDLIRKVGGKAEASAKAASERIADLDGKQSKHDRNIGEVAKRISTTDKQYKSTTRKLANLENDISHQKANIQGSENWRIQAQKTVSLLETRISDNTQRLQSNFNAIYALVKSSFIEKENTLSSIKLNMNQLLQELETLNTKRSKASEPLLNTEDYLAFENIYRGSEEAIKQRLSFYRKPIEECMKAFDPNNCLIADLGCGRGEWLSLLKSWGYQNVIGIDHNESMYRACLTEGYTTIQTDLFDYLSKQKPSSHQLISAFHLVEHLNNNELNELAKELLRVLKPGGYFLFETPNSANVAVGSSTFYLDPTHEKPLPFELSKFFFQRRGFQVDQSFFLNGFGIEFDLGKSSKRAKMGAFFERWFGIGLDYSILIRKPLK